ncbi:hypothetical protein AURDEDRAFT_133191 [Auricularia subglabra TFB-10046 SS5]|nr:hypothetical protein AURDEDRAFT_133191 [Auricularia subglabra TFB-10046 SS5]
MIFAGDFAQLPPVLGITLYNSKVGDQASTSYNQPCALGKALWFQVVTVVLLTENMRQREMSTVDKQFREALVNMRFKQCTKADIDLLNTMVVDAGATHSMLEDNNYRHVSVITGVNSHRDMINKLGCEKFSRDVGEPLHDFYSIDKIGEHEDEPYRKKQRGQKRWKTSISQKLRDLLWNASHYDSKNVPGILRICLGMPVIIKKNVATECGITNEGEGIVVGWESSQIEEDRESLDVLFIRLTNGTLNIQLDGLPPNVVPICAEEIKTLCKLPDDSVIMIRRRQVPVLPNFSMTDYSSQGKTRIYNVVDLLNLKSHQGYYTALSRSAFAKNTLILQGFNASRLQGGLQADLLAEFRDIEILNDITRLEFEGKLPRNVEMQCDAFYIHYIQINFQMEPPERA